MRAKQSQGVAGPQRSAARWPTCSRTLGPRCSPKLAVALVRASAREKTLQIRGVLIRREEREKGEPSSWVQPRKQVVGRGRGRTDGDGARARSVLDRTLPVKVDPALDRVVLALARKARHRVLLGVGGRVLLGLARLHRVGVGRDAEHGARVRVVLARRPEVGLVRHELRGGRYEGDEGRRRRKEVGREGRGRGARVRQLDARRKTRTC